MTTERKVNLGFAIGLGFMITLGGAACLSGWSLLDSAQRLNHSYEVLRAIEDLHIQLLRLESQTRGYALGGPESILTQYDDRRSTVLARLNELQTLSAGDAEQSGRLHQLKPLVEQKLAFLDALIAARRDGRTDDVEAMASQGRGLQVMHDSVQIVRDFEEHERVLLAGLNASATRGGIRTLGVVTAGWLFAILCAVLSGISIHRDLRLRRRIEEALQESNDELEFANKRLTASNEQLDAFSYSVSHDLRVPLRAIEGYSRMLIEDHAHSLNPEGHRLLDVVRSSTKEMGQLIDDLLTFSRAGRQALDIAPVDMAKLTQEVWEELTIGLDTATPSIEIHPLPEANGDRSTVRQVLSNLLANAIKFSSKSCEPRVQVGSQRQNGAVAYYVRDNGCGFDMQFADKLFKVFQRLHRKEEFEGSGVGLALVQNVVQRHGGHVWAESVPGQGATFYFTLAAPSERRGTLSAS